MTAFLGKLVMPGLDPGIHAAAGPAGGSVRRVDGRNKFGRDDPRLRQNPAVTP